jgi:hypothetical protein
MPDGQAVPRAGTDAIWLAHPHRISQQMMIATTGSTRPGLARQLPHKIACHGINGHSSAVTWYGKKKKKKEQAGPAEDGFLAGG